MDHSSGVAPNHAHTGSIQRKVGEWSDVEAQELEELISDTQASHWRDALAKFQPKHPSFVKRVQNLGLADWQLLLWLQREGSALDVGCGHGTLALGLGWYFGHVLGIDVLHKNLQFANLRARQEGQKSTNFAQMNALALGFADGSFDLVTMNGSLEWAALNVGGDPSVLQAQMLREARRVLKKEGLVAIAIENRFAAETLLGLPDTHTGIHFLPALPKLIAKPACYAVRHEPYRSYLYSGAGYRRLLRTAGFETVQILDLVSSYNDYQYVISCGDGLSYGFLYRNRYVRGFYDPADVARRLLARVFPRALGAFSYAYLVVGGRNGKTVLDESHRIWSVIEQWGLTPGAARFACKGNAGGTMAVITHDGEHCTGLVEFGTGLSNATMAPSVLGDSDRERFAAGARLLREGIVEGIKVRVFHT